MSNKKQSSIEWLIGQLKVQYDIDIERLTVTDKSKAMHKEEIMDAYDKGEFNDNMNETAEQYYTKTYNND